MATTITVAQLDGIKQPVVIDPTKKPGRGNLVMRTQQLDFDTFDTFTSVTSASADTYQMINVYPGEWVLAAGVVNLVAATAAATYHLGMTAGVTTFFTNAQAANDAEDPTCTTKGFDTPFYCVTADTIDLLVNTQAPTPARIQVWALILRPSGKNTITGTKRTF